MVSLNKTDFNRELCVTAHSIRPGILVKNEAPRLTTRTIG